jgi:hypothetical protein
MASDQFTDRIPVGQGVHVRFLKDGRALFGGCDESEVVPKVDIWLRDNPAHGNRARVEIWLEQKIKQIEQDRETQQARAKRAEVDVEVHRLAVRTTLLRGHEDLVRRHIYEARGIPAEED